MVKKHTSLIPPGMIRSLHERDRYGRMIDELRIIERNGGLPPGLMGSLGAITDKEAWTDLAVNYTYHSKYIGIYMGD